jgi:formylglycine-generating enzyme required for sulfatase activity
MILLRGGTFQMGTDGVGPGTEDMGPAHTVKLPDFRIDETEVTVAAYRACVNAGGCTAAEPKAKGQLEGCTWDEAGLDSDPINCVTWPQADAYCKWAGKQLPTEEQWEYAARGKSGRDFPWGMGIPAHDNWGAPDDVESYITACPVGWHGSVYRTTCPVGGALKGNTPEGVKDLGGNVAEWTASLYCKYDSPRCGDERRVVRGGSNRSAGSRLVGTFRGCTEPMGAIDEIGFRCAQAVERGKPP